MCHMSDTTHLQLNTQTNCHEHTVELKISYYGHRWNVINKRVTCTCIKMILFSLQRMILWTLEFQMPNKLDTSSWLVTLTDEQTR